MMTDKKNPPTITKPSSIKTRFAVKFLRAMKKLNNNDRPYSSSSSSRSMSERQKRYRAIRAASHASMASAVGSRRAWSRAVLMKIRNRKQLTTYYSLMMNKRRRDRRRAIRRNNGIFLMRGNPSDDHRREDDGGLDRFGGEEEDDLRELVPGGEGMDFCRLLNETAHYIKCLRAQIMGHRSGQAQIGPMKYECN